MLRLMLSWRCIASRSSVRGIFVGEELETPGIFDGDDSYAMPAPTLLSWDGHLTALGIEDNTTPAAHADPSY